MRAAHPARRAAEALDKDYLARIRFGAATDTLDPEGAVVAEGRVPERAPVEAALPAFTGDILQAPPAYSAVHVDGRRAHELARAAGRSDPAARQCRGRTVSLLGGVGAPRRGARRQLLAAGPTSGRSPATSPRAWAPCAFVERLPHRVGGFRVEEAVAPEDFQPARDLRDPRILFERCPPLHLLEVGIRVP